LGVKHEFNTPDTPQTGSTMVEQRLEKEVLLLEDGVRGRLHELGGSESNKMKPGQAPDATLGELRPRHAGAVRLTCYANDQKRSEER